MKLRIISDIHCDINSGQNTNFDFAPDDFVICCGDISGDRITTEQWINNNLKQGIVVGGNHLGYTHFTYDKEESLNLSIKYLQNKLVFLMDTEQDMIICVTMQHYYFLLQVMIMFLKI